MKVNDELVREDEEWREVPGYPRYEVSSWGRLRNIVRGRFMAMSKISNGYLGTRLYDGEAKRASNTICIHRLVAEVFVKNVDYGLFVRHVDGDKTNNYYRNLYWSEKYKDGFKAYREDARLTGFRISRKKVEELYLSDPNRSLKEFVDIICGRLVGM